MRYVVLSIILITVVFRLNVQAQLTEESLAIAAYQADGNLYVFNVDADPILVMEQFQDRFPDAYETAPQWSPDGRFLVYPRVGSGSDLYMSPIDDLSTQEQIPRPEYSNVFAFSDDAQSLIYTTFGEWEDAATPDGYSGGTWQQTSLIIEELSLSTGNQQVVSDNPLRLIHVVDMNPRMDIMASCPTYGIEITESRWLYLQPHILADTPYGLVTYMNQQTSEYDRPPELQINGSPVEAPIMTHVGLTHNSEQLVFTVEHENQIGFMDLSSQAIQVYDIPHEAQAITGDGERYLYYSVQIEGDEALIPREYWEYDPFWYLSCAEHINEVAIYQFDTETGQHVQIHRDAHHSIPWMTLSPDGQEIYFTAIPNGEMWRDAMVKGHCVVEECRDYLYPNLYRVAVQTQESELVLENVLKPVINFAYLP